jgi:hypothetical protein
MTRFSIQYEEPTPGRPPPNAWTVLRVFVWTLLLACMGLWCWTFLAA